MGSDMLANSCPFIASLRAVSTRVSVYVRFDLANVRPAPPALIGSGTYGVSLCGTVGRDRRQQTRHEQGGRGKRRVSEVVVVVTRLSCPAQQ